MRSPGWSAPSCWASPCAGFFHPPHSDAICLRSSLVASICVDGTLEVGGFPEKSQAQATAPVRLLASQDGLHPDLRRAQKTNATAAVAAAERGERQRLCGAAGCRSRGGLRTGATTAGGHAREANQIARRQAGDVTERPRSAATRDPPEPLPRRATGSIWRNFAGRGLLLSRDPEG